MTVRPYGARLADQANIVHKRTAIAASSTQVDLGRPCTKIKIWLDAGSSGLHINLLGTAATTSFPLIPSGGSYTYEGPPISSFYVIGTGTTGSFNVIAQ